MWVTEKVAPAGSASTAVLPIGVSEGATTVVPFSLSAVAAATSTSCTQKSTLQCAGALPATSDIVATTSRETGCSGSPPTYPGRRNIVMLVSPRSKVSVVQPKRVA